MGFLIDLTERERHRRASASLAAVGRDLARSLDAEATARRIVEAVAEILRASFAAVYRLRPAGDLGLLAVTGGGAEFPRDFVVPGDTGLSAIALRNRTPVTSADILEDPRVVLTPESRAILEASRLRSMVCVPLLVHDAPIGTLIAADAGGRTFGEDEVALVQTFADQAAVALENARLYEEAERRRMESEALEEVAASIGASLDLDTVLQRVTEAARRLAGSDIARIALVEADGEAAVFRYWSGPHPDDLSSRRLERGKGLGGMVLATGTPARTDAYADDPRLTQDYAALVRADRTVTGLAVPIDIRGRVGGLLLVFNQSPRPFSDRDEAVLVRLASHAAIAITNAQLFDEAQRSEVRFRSLIEQGLDIITVLDADGIIRYGSPSIEHVLGYAPSALLGRAALDLVHPDDAAAVAALLRDAIPRPGHVASLEFRFRHHDGTWRVLESVGHNLLHVPAVRGIVVNSRDVTDRRVAEQALLQSEKLATMGQLLAGVAHELNNPLSVIVGHAELLGMMLASDDPRMVHAQQLAAAALRCARIVKSFLALARQRSTERQATALNDVVREAIDLLAYPLRVDSVEVALDLEPGLPDLSADPHQLHQVIVNLVTNAHHAMREVTGPRRLTIRTRSIEDGRAVRLVIGDTGPGMSPELQARIFEPFFTTKAAGQGTGLGLPLCEGIVEAHGGTITVESVVGQGTSFVITLPVEPPPTAGLAAGAGAVAPARGKSILVIDDETDVAEVIADILRPAHHVETATDGPTALAKIRARAWDVILCDVRMPGFDGPRIYREAAGSAPGVERRFAFLTGDALSPESRTFLESTAVPSLAKPFTVEDIERVVQEVLAAR
jgi:two-component system NtrC family sensor kinase